jgi:hypothetical protein
VPAASQQSVVLAETAVDGLQRVGDMYQKSSGTPLASVKTCGHYKPTVLRTGELGTTEVAAFLR